MNWWDWVIETDMEVFSFIHSDASTPALDGFMKLLRNALTWAPLYAFMLFWIIRYNTKYAFAFILLTIVCFGITDYVSASILKPWLSRPRPCYEPELQPILRDLVGCGGQYGFPSSHASNHFGLATFWYWSIYFIRGKKWHWLWVWAALICYAQIYVGKHYPLDIIGGAVFGFLTGSLLAKIFERWMFPNRALYRHKRTVPEFN